MLFLMYKTTPESRTLNLSQLIVLEIIIINTLFFNHIFLLTFLIQQMQKFLLLFNQQKFEDALQSIEKILTASKKKYEPLVWKSKTLLAMKRIDQSLIVANSAIMISSQRQEATQIKSKILIMMGKYEEALVILEKLEIGNKDSAENYYLFGYALTKQKQYLQALRKYQKCISKNKFNDPCAFIGKAETLAFLGSLKQAKKFLDYAKKALEEQQNLKDKLKSELIDIKYYFQDYDKVLETVKKIEKEVSVSHKKRIRSLQIQIESQLIKQMSTSIFLRDKSIFRASCIKYDKKINNEYDIDKTSGSSDSFSIFSCCFSQQDP